MLGNVRQVRCKSGKRHAMVSALKQAIEVKDSTLVVQYEVKASNGFDANPAYTPYTPLLQIDPTASHDLLALHIGLDLAARRNSDAHTRAEVCRAQELTCVYTCVPPICA